MQFSKGTHHFALGFPCPRWFSEWLIFVGEVKTTYTVTNKQGFIFQCSTYQMGILLQFNDQDEITADQLGILTSLTKGALYATLAVCD